MKVARERYQHGHIRKVSRTGGGFAWEYFYRETGPDGKRRQRVQTFQADEYPTEASVWKAIEGQLASLNSNTLAGKVSYTFGQLIDRYLRDELPNLAWSTQGTNRSLLELHIRPRWADTRLADIKAGAVKAWIDKLPFGAASKARSRNIISRLLDLAMLWELTPTVERNPMQLVKVKGASKRQKPLSIVSVALFKKLVDALPSPINLIIFITGCLGLRISETLGLKWSDINESESSIAIQRVYTHSRLKDVPKTDAGWRVLPLHKVLLDRLLQWKKESKPKTDDGFIFRGSRGGKPRSDSTMLTDYIKPAAKKLGIENFGYHCLRHSYKVWMSGKGVVLTQQKDLLGHADIETTANVYGKTLTEEMRVANALVVDELI